MFPASADTGPDKPPRLTIRQQLANLIIWLRGQIVWFGQQMRGTVQKDSTEKQKSLVDKTPDALSEAHLHLYGVCRDKVKHENDLTNHRLSWNFAIQGFLFAAYALCLQTMGSLQVALTSRSLDDAARASLDAMLMDLRTSVLWVARAGAIVSILICLGAAGAQIAIWSIIREFHQRHPEYKLKSSKWNSHGEHLPGILGGGNPLAHMLGMLAPLSIPLIFAYAWWMIVISRPHP